MEKSPGVASDIAEPHIGWLRAVLTASAIVVVGTALLVYVPNFVLTRLHSTSRSTRVAIATSVFFIVIFVLAFGLRQLQRRKII